MLKKKISFKIKYVGNTQETMVPGLGVFLKDQEVSFEDPDQVDHAKSLVKTNVNFEEAEE